MMLRPISAIARPRPLSSWHGRAFLCVLCVLCGAMGSSRASAGAPPDWSRSLELGGAWNYGLATRANASDTITTQLGWGPGGFLRLRSDASNGWGLYVGARYAESRTRYVPTGDTTILGANFTEPLEATDRALAATVGGLYRVRWRDFALEPSVGVGWAMRQAEREGAVSHAISSAAKGGAALEASVGVTARLNAIWWIAVGASGMYTGPGESRVGLATPTVWTSWWVSLRWQFHGPVEVPETGSRLAR